MKAPHGKAPPSVHDSVTQYAGKFQPYRLIVHLVNLTNAGTWCQPVHELIPVGPLHVKVQVPDGISAKRARLLVLPESRKLGWQAVLPPPNASLLDHEVSVFD